MIPLMSEEFEKDNPVTAQTIKCFAIGLGASCNVLVFFVAPIVTIILVVVRKISPWWLFLGCGPLALGLCLSCCAVCVYCIVDCYVRYAYYVCWQERMKAKRLKNEAINQAAPLADTNLKKAGIDSSDRFYALLKSLGDNQKELLSEFQFSFVVFLIGQVIWHSSHTMPTNDLEIWLQTSIMPADFERDRPVTAATIDCLFKSCTYLAFFVLPLVIVILVCMRILSPWWLFLGFGPYIVLISVFVCVVIYKIILENCVPRPAKKNKAITQATPV
ncbi:hypothetical protein Ddc_10513 [Ditylenchus destructor]|nr:hypothetical protein Ddc_10513 [Ditylenchus destructor]